MDALSPLLFCLAILLLSHALKKQNGYRIRRSTVKASITHMLYTDDLNLSIVDRVASAVGMKLGLRKCRVAHMQKGNAICIQRLDDSLNSAICTRQQTISLKRDDGLSPFPHCSRSFSQPLVCEQRLLNHLHTACLTTNRQELTLGHHFRRLNLPRDAQWLEPLSSLLLWQ